MNISEIQENPQNPRFIKDDVFYKKIPGYDKYFFGSDGTVISKRRKMKEVKGSPDKDGYLKITLVDKKGNFKYYRKHRLIMWAFNGNSKKQVNHKDGNKTNNRIENLEYVTSMENQCHRRVLEGFEPGVCWAKKEKKWRSYIQINKKWEHLGFYEKKEDAKNAYLKKLNELGIINKYAN